MKIAHVLLVLTVISSAICSVNILRPDGEVCLGIAATFTCTVNGNILGWRYGGVGSAPELYVNPSGSTTLRSLGSSPFSTRVTNVTGGVITSIATTSNLTRDADQMTLECSNGSFTSDTTEVENVTLPLENSSPATSAFSSFDPVGARIHVTWSGATCIPLYSVLYWVSIINEDLDAIDGTTVRLSGTSFFYKPQYPGFYSFQINSINYFGEDLGSIPTLPSISYPWLAPTTMINVEFVDNIGLVVSFQENNIGQPPVTDCSIILNDISTACQLSGNYTFPIRDGVNYTYNVTVGNVVGSINETGNVLDLIRPTTVLIFMTETVMQVEVSAIGNPVIFAVPFIVLGVLIALSICWILLRICWKRQWCSPRIWRSSFWLLFFCYDCCTYDAEVEERNVIGLKNPNAGGEKGTDTSL